MKITQEYLEACGFNEIYEWETIGCEIHGDGYIYSHLCKRAIGKLKSDGTEDQRFTADGLYSQYNGWMRLECNAANDGLKDELAQLDDSFYEPIWQDREDAIAEILKAGLDRELIEKATEKLLKKKADFEKRMAEEEKLKEEAKQLAIEKQAEEASKRMQLLAGPEYEKLNKLLNKMEKMMGKPICYGDDSSYTIIKKIQAGLEEMNGQQLSEITKFSRNELNAQLNGKLISDIQLILGWNLGRMPA